MTYLQGHQSPEIADLQRALAALGLYRFPIDGGFGPNTLAAVIAAQDLYGLEPADGVVRADLLLELGITAPKPKTTSISIFSQIGTIVSIIKALKGLQMDTQNVDVKSAWLSSKNWAAGIAILTSIAAFFHIVIPPDAASTVTTFVDSAAALYILVKNTWFTTTITTASAKKL